MEIITGGVTAAKGFLAAGVEAGIKYQNRKDMAMVYSKTPCRAAGVFTTNVVKDVYKRQAHNTFEEPDAVKEEPFEGVAEKDGTLSLEIPACSVICLRIS